MPSIAETHAEAMSEIYSACEAWLTARERYQDTGGVADRADLDAAKKVYTQVLSDHQLVVTTYLLGAASAFGDLADRLGFKPS